MKTFKIITALLALTLAATEVPQDAILVSSATKTIVETETKEWRTIQFTADPASGEIAVMAVYESVVRVDGQLKSRQLLREASIPWSQATNIAPALVLVREQFKAAMPTILTNAP
jgi:hypothetical protein